MSEKVHQNQSSKKSTGLGTRDFRQFLQLELAKRCQANPRYSLRAFASFLKIEPSFLSKLLNGKKGITSIMIDRLSERLGLAPQDVLTFRVSSQSEAWNSADSSPYRNLTLDHFQVIADWYHYAILELISVRDFEPSPAWIAKKLGITLSEVKIAIERLVRLNFIVINAKGQWKNVSGNNTTVANRFTAVAFRRLQKQVLEKAIEALENLGYEERDQTSMTFAIDRELLGETREKIKEFRRELVRSLQAKSKNKNAVFNLGISLYPVTRN